MATLKRGILGGFTGSVANVVGSSWKGIDVMRSKPLSVANPRTAAQTAQRSKFGNVVAIASLLLVSVIKPLWDRFAQRQSGYNSFVSGNIDNFDDSGLTDFMGFDISRGILTPAPITAAEWTNGSPDVAIIWTNNTGAGTALGTDEVFAVAYNATKDEWGVSAQEDTRASAPATIIMPSNIATGDVVHVWLAFRRVDGTIVSNTSYALAEEV